MIFPYFLLLWPKSFPQKSKKINWADRKDLETTVKKYIETADDSHLLTLYGPRGSGKTALWKKLLRRRPGVLHVKLDGDENAGAIRSKVLQHLLPLPIWSIPSNVSDSFASAVFRRIGRITGGSILVFDVNVARGVSDKDKLEALGRILVKSARSFVDEGVCTVFLDVSVLLLAEAFSDEPRIKFIPVGDFKPEEGMAFLNENAVSGETFDEKQVKENVFRKIGQNPNNLLEYLRAGDRDAFVKDIVGEAQTRYKDVVRNYPAYRQTLKWLAEGDEERQKDGKGYGEEKDDFVGKVGLSPDRVMQHTTKRIFYLDVVTRKMMFRSQADRYVAETTPLPKKFLGIF